MRDISIPQDLIEQVARNNCVLFIGAGTLSVGGDSISQEGLLSELASYLDQQMTSTDLPKVADYYELVLGRHSLVDRFCGWVDRQPYSPDIDHLIAELPAAIVLSTRTDKHLEQAYSSLRKRFVKIVDGEDLSFSDTGKTMIVKLHGCQDQKGSLILTERDRLGLFAGPKVLSEFVRIVYATSTVLFLGWDLSDMYFRWLHREILQETGQLGRQAYAVVSAMSDLDRKYWGQERIHVIECELPLFLRSLRQELGMLPTANGETIGDCELLGLSYPYKFLDYYETEESVLFCGRKPETERLSRQILTHRMMVLLGDSGSGKTSLIKAGLIPELDRLGAFAIYSRGLDTPLTAVGMAISDALSAHNKFAADVRDFSSFSLSDLLLRCQQSLGRRLVLLVDQFEEVLRLSYESQRDFVRALAECLRDPRLDLRLVLSLRSDFFTDLETYRDLLPTVFHNVFVLRNLSEKGALEAIVIPAGYFGVKYEDALLNNLLMDIRADGSISPAQLQIICDRLYQRFSSEKTITAEHYASQGGARAILGDYLGEVLGAFSIPRRQKANRILQSLVSGSKAKKLLPEDEIASQCRLDIGDIRDELSELEGRRLVRRIDTDSGCKYEIVHEYIVEEIWQSLTERETRIKEVQEMLSNEARFWPKYQAPISASKLEDIYKYWDDLTLSDDELRLVFRSSISFGQVKQWNEATASLGDRLPAMYQVLLLDSSYEVSRLSAIALANLGMEASIDSLLSKDESDREREIRHALRQLREGRPSEDFAAQATDREWKEKSLWNTSEILGIDFGTTSSAVAIVRNGKPVLIPNREGAKFTPSVVSVTENGEVSVGKPAVLQAIANPAGTVFDVKRAMGTDWSIDIGGVTYTAEDIASKVFVSLRQDAEAYLEREVSGAVITVPAYFDHSQRSSVHRAAEKAGWSVARLVAEPTAASLAYGLDSRYSRRIAVFDLGGGTFDISILELGEGVFEVQAINGNAQLGGSDFDERVVRYLIDEFRHRHQIDLSEDPVAIVRLKEAAEQAKVALSGLETVSVYVPYIHSSPAGVTHLEVNLTRDKFEELTTDLVGETLRCCERALKDAERGWTGDIDELVLVGLSTKIPVVRESVSRLFGKPPRQGVDPDEAVVFGAAIQGAVLSGQLKDHVLLDVISFSLGIEIVGGEFFSVIKRCTTIPARKSEMLTTARDGQTSVAIRVLEGDRERVEENRTLGCLRLDGIGQAQGGMPRLEVVFDIDANETVVVSIEDKESGKTQDLTISSSVIRQGLDAEILSTGYDPSILPVPVDD